MKPAHILIVEDEEHIGEGIRFNLEADGYRVTLVEDGPTALELMKTGGHSIDLIVLDLMLPGMSGYTVCEQLRQSGQRLPVLMLSARTLAEDRARGFDVGANQYMNKPFELDELLSRVKNLLQTGASRGAEPGTATESKDVRIGDVRVNFGTHQAFVGEEMLSLTSQQVRLLQYFVDHPNRVISRAELLAKVWDRSGNLQTRVVDQFVARLRKIIEPDRTRPVFLRTVRDAGYRFVPEGNVSE